MTRRRKFPRRVYWAILHRQKLICACGCNVKITRKEGYQFDHWTPLALGGADNSDNLRALRLPCHKAVTRLDIQMIRKADRCRKSWNKEKWRHLGSGRKLQSRPFDTRLRRKFNGRVEVRT